MGKKMMNIGSWQWLSCAHSKTLSFRANENNNNNNIFKTINSIFLDPSTDHNGVLEIETTPKSWFTSSSESASFSTESDETGEPQIELIIKGVRSERLFFEPNCTSSLILEEHKASQDHQNQNQEPEKDGDDDQESPFTESVVLAMESDDPYLDFKKSIEEMVESHEIKDWESLQELLGWYLKMNGKINHGFIIGAFVDLLIEFSPPPPPPSGTSDSMTSTCYSSAASSFSAPSSPLSLVVIKEIEEQEKGSSSTS